MSISDEMLMAYADGELEAAERAQVEAAMKADPDVARRVERHKALRRQLNATFDRVLDEPVPDRLVAAVRGSRASSSVNATAGASAVRGVTDLDRVRAEKAVASATRVAQARASWSWPQWGAMAASLVVGAVIGHFALNAPELGPIGSHAGQLVAQAALADALSNQLASTQSADAPVQIGTSFKAKAGDFCRTFVLQQGEPVGGLACRAGDTWRIDTLARVEPGPAADGGYRPAGSDMPTPVRAAVETQISGEPLDASGEEQAKNNGWK
jgi:anti-sigma factor RsiW